MERSRLSCRKGEVILKIGKLTQVFKKSGGLIAALLFIAVFFTSSGYAFDFKDLPTREKPLIIDTKHNAVMIYTEVNHKNVSKLNSHWGVVSKNGKLADKAILIAHCNHLDFHDALIKIGAKPGNTLTKNSDGKYVEGETIQITAIIHGNERMLALNEIFFDEKGKGFNIKFGGNRKASEEEKTGCITCLESCWVAITSNANYPQIGNFKRLVKPNSRFKGVDAVLDRDGKPVILIYKLSG